MRGKLLITGGTGYLGSRIARLMQPFYEITLQTVSGRKLDDNYHYFKADFSRPDDLSQLQKQDFDYVIHLASYNEMSDPEYGYKALKINTEGTRNLLDHLPPSVRHFIYFSTFHVYGKKEGVITEDTPPDPVHDYALTHWFAEKYVEQFHRTKGLPYTIFRLSNSYGCPEYSDSSKWYLILNDLARMAWKDRMIKLNSNGKAMRDYVWMNDVAEACKAVLHMPAQNTLFNLGSGKSYSTYFIAEQVRDAYLEVTGRRIPIEVNESDTSSGNELYFHNSKLLRLTGITFHEAFQQEAKAIFELLS